MKYMYTNTPDEGCHEIADGVYGRPVHQRDYAALRATGWVFNLSNLLPEENTSLIAEYVDRFGKKPHHKMLPETIKKAIEDHDKALSGEPDPDVAGD